MTKESENKEKTSAWCNACGQETDHYVLHRESRPWSYDLDAYSDISGNNTYEMLSCCGCKAVLLRHIHWHSEVTDGRGEPITETEYYPPTVTRSKPDWLAKVDSPFGLDDTTIEEFLNEIYVALHNKSLRLAAIGIRALLEYIMVDKVNDQGSITKNIDAFIKAGHITETQKDDFNSKVIEAGHAAMHRNYKPRETDLKTLLDITESLIANIYIYPDRMKKLANAIPPRRP